MSQPQIVIDPDEELRIVCRLLFYNIPGFHPNAKKLHKACQEEGYSFRLQDITKWVKYQYSYQIYRHPLPCKAEASFSKIKIPNKIHQQQQKIPIQPFKILPLLLQLKQLKLCAARVIFFLQTRKLGTSSNLQRVIFSASTIFKKSALLYLKTHSFLHEELERKRISFQRKCSLGKIAQELKAKNPNFLH